MIETFKGRLSQHKNVDKLNCNLDAFKLFLIKQLVVQLMVVARGEASFSSSVALKILVAIVSGNLPFKPNFKQGFLV